MQLVTLPAGSVLDSATCLASSPLQFMAVLLLLLLLLGLDLLADGSGRCKGVCQGERC
jgi:hypothetical protein